MAIYIDHTSITFPAGVRIYRKVSPPAMDVEISSSKQY